ncbi:MAG: MFS transporter [Pseudomonadota bacterium]
MPKGALLIVHVEFWERFSFYGMLAIFVLFLTNPTSNGGFGWDKASALGLVGLYSGLSYGLPVFGGFLADRFIGPHLAITLGTATMTVGHLLLAAPALVPTMIGGADVAAFFESEGFALGRFQITAEVQTSIQRAALEDGLDSAAAVRAYRAVTMSFYAALACLVVGNSLMKSILTVQLGNQFQLNDPNRDTAFSYYYLSISAAGLVAGILVGTIGERIGWHYGFSIAGIGMSFAFLSYAMCSRRWLSARSLQSEKIKNKAAHTTISAFPRLVLICLCAVFLALFMASWFQLFGSWMLFIQQHVDQNVFGFEMPTSWMISINSIVVILAAPLLAWTWLKLAKRSIVLDFPAKLCIALSIAAVSQGLFILTASNPAPILLLPLLAIGLISVSEVIAWVPAYSFVYRIAPQGYTASVMGLFYLITMGLSGFLAGQLGKLGEYYGYLQFFQIMAMGTVMIAAVFFALAWAMRRQAKRLQLEL